MTENIKDENIINSIKSEANSRMKNPLIASFIFSWVVWNWKSILFLIFANKDIERKIEILISD